MSTPLPVFVSLQNNKEETQSASTSDPLLVELGKVMDAAAVKMDELHAEQQKTVRELNAALSKAVVLSNALESMMLQAEGLMMLAQRAKTGSTPEARQLAVAALVEHALSLETPDLGPSVLAPSSSKVA